MTSGADVVAYANSQRGKPYVFGARGPNSFDCSGLVQYVYKHFGLSTPGTTSTMMASNSNLIKINRGDLQPGDLIFSHWGSGGPHSHVAIYTGNNEVIEAPEPGKTVTLTKLGDWFWPHVDAYRRVPGINGAGTVGNLGSGPGNTGDTIDPIRSVLTLGGKAIGALYDSPGNVTEALTNVGTGIIGVAQGASEIGALASVVTRAFLPSNLLRGAFLVSGIIFVLIGIWFLAREIKESSP